MSKIFIGILGLIIVVVVGGALVYSVYFSLPKQETPNGKIDNPVFCTMEAKLCPDGSYVGRTGPKCEFAVCPAPKGEGTIKGKVSIGPLCPVEPCSVNITNPYVSRSIILKTKTGKIIKTISLFSDGSFSAKAGAGVYVLDLSDCNFLGCRYLLPKEAVIEPSKTTEINIDIDTGIR